VEGIVNLRCAVYKVFSVGHGNRVCRLSKAEVEAQKPKQRHDETMSA